MRIDPSHAQRNIVALSAHHPEAAKTLMAELKTRRERGVSSEFQLTRNPRGLPTLTSLLSAPPLDLHQNQSPHQLAQRIANEIHRRPSELIALWSIGAGYALRALGPPNENRRIIVIEPAIDILLEWLRIADWRPWLTSPHLIIFCGEKAHRDANELFQCHPSLTRRGAILLMGRDELPGDHDCFRALQKTLTAALERNRSIASSVEINPRGAVIASGDAHKELIGAIAEEARVLGWQATTATRPAKWARFFQEPDTLWETLGRPAPSATITFTPQALREAEWAALSERGSRRLLWCYDDPARGLDANRLNENFDAVYCFDPVHTQRLARQCSIPVEYLPAATMFAQPPDSPALDDALPPPQIAFVGSTGLQRMDDAALRFARDSHGPMGQLREWVENYLRQGDSVPYEPLLAQNFLGMETTVPVALLEDLATYAVRVHFLAALADSPLTIYGDAGWGEEAFVGALRNRWFGRPLDFLRETPWIYRSGAIHINLFNVQCVNSPTIRMLDVMACGGFLLTEYRPFISTCFRIGEELETFRDREELRDKTEYFLAHPAKRKEIALAGQRRVLAEHRYRDRLERVLGAAP